MLHDTLWCPGLRLAEAPILPVWIEPQALCSALGVQQEAGTQPQPPRGHTPQRPDAHLF